MTPSRAEFDRARFTRPGSFYAFVREAWPYIDPAPAKFSAFHRRICDELEATGETSENLAIHLPPRHGKSIILVLYLLWLWLQNPRLNFAVISHTPALAGDLAEKSLRLIRSDWWQARFKGLVDVLPDCAVRNYANVAVERGGRRRAFSVGEQITGFGADVLVIDDPLNANATTADVDFARNLFTEVLPSRVDHGGRMVLCCQRTNMRDLGALAEEQDWRRLVLPIVDDRGYVLWPERYSRANVDAIYQRVGPRAFATQFLQAPVAAEGNEIHRDWLQTRTSLPRVFSALVISCDPILKPGPDSDWCVVQLWARHGAGYYLLEQVRRKMDEDEASEIIAAIHERWDCRPRIVVEGTAAGPPIMRTLQRRFGLGSKEYKPGRASKEERFATVRSVFSGLGVWLPPESEAPWVRELKDEWLAFPGGKHDDQVDAAVIALQELSTGSPGQPHPAFIRAFGTPRTVAGRLASPYTGEPPAEAWSVPPWRR
jgi:predicted phage terminase large subunit-like protein